MTIKNVSIESLNPYIEHYSHFSFDLWLTLIKSNPLFKQKRDELVKSFFHITAPLQTVQKTMRYYDVLCNKISEKTGLHIHRKQIYLMVLNALEIDIMSLTEQHFEQFYQQVDALFLEYKPLLMNESIPLLFKQMKEQNKSINILSNTAFIHGASLRKLLHYYDLSPYISFDLYSDEIGFSKPNINFFNKMIDEVQLLKNIDIKSIVHIGDNENADILGAKNVGLNSILIKN